MDESDYDLLDKIAADELSKRGSLASTSSSCSAGFKKEEEVTAMAESLEPIFVSSEEAHLPEIRDRIARNCLLGAKDAAIRKAVAEVALGREEGERQRLQVSMRTKRKMELTKNKGRE